MMAAAVAAGFVFGLAALLSWACRGDMDDSGGGEW